MSNLVGENIRKFRELRGYSQEYMAHELEITQSSYAKLEKQETKLTIDRLQRIAEILEVDMNLLLNAGNQQVFNIYQNHNSANGYIAEFHGCQHANELIAHLKSQVEELKADKAHLQKLLEARK